MENRSKNDAKIDRKIIMKTDSQNLEFLLPVEAGSSKMTFQRVLNPLKIEKKSIWEDDEFFGGILEASWRHLEASWEILEDKKKDF